MKTIKVFCLPSHQTKERTSGVDYARVLQPMKYLNGYENGSVRFHIDFYDIFSEKQPNWMDIAKEYDIVFLNYTVLDWQYAAMGSFVHGEHKKIIMDIDDDIWDVQSDNIVHDQLKAMDASWKLTCMLNDVDGIVTTNRYLRNIIISKTNRYSHDILIGENQVDFTHYNRTYPAKDTGKITLMHFGSTSHFNDLIDPSFMEGVDRIMKRYPNVHLKTIGSFLSELRYKWNDRYSHAYGDADIYKWIGDKFPIYMDEADIMVVPLRDTIYNRCKSDIKFLEASTAMKPGVFNATRPYTDTLLHGKTGYLVKTPEDWYIALEKLILDVNHRQEIGMNAYEYVKQNRQMKNNIENYANFFSKILDK